MNIYTFIHLYIECSYVCMKISNLDSIIFVIWFACIWFVMRLSSNNEENVYTSYHPVNYVKLLLNKKKTITVQYSPLTTTFVEMTESN